MRCRDGFFGVIQAIEQSGAGDVVVVDGGGRETALAGELFARVALRKELAGIIIDGGYRDLRFIATLRLPVYSRHVSPRAGTTSRLAVLRTPTVSSESGDGFNAPTAIRHPSGRWLSAASLHQPWPIPLGRQKSGPRQS